MGAETLLKLLTSNVVATSLPPDPDMNVPTGSRGRRSGPLLLDVRSRRKFRPSGDLGCFEMLDEQQPSQASSSSLCRRTSFLHFVIVLVMVREQVKRRAHDDYNPTGALLDSWKVARRRLTETLRRNEET